MQVTINTFLNARNGSPSTKAANPHYLEPATSLEIDDVVIGEELEGNSVWYHSTDGNYYWSGGVQDTDFLLPSKTFATLDDNTKNGILRSLVNEQADVLRKTIPGFMGCAYGLKNDELAAGLCLVIYVDRKSGDAATSVVKETLNYKGLTIPTDVKEAGAFIHYSYSDENKQYYRAHFPPDTPRFTIGGSVVSEATSEDDYGTRGVLVQRDNDFFIFSCFHVLFPTQVGSDPVIEKVGATGAAHYPSAVANPTPGQKRGNGIVTEGTLSSTYDYALMEIGQNEVKNQIDQHKTANISATIAGHYSKEELNRLIGLPAKIYGAKSGFQTGLLTDIGKADSMGIGNFVRSYTDLLYLEKVSEPGDSGAPVIGPDNRLIGYIIGGSSPDAPLPHKSLALPWYYLNDFKNLKIV